MAREGPYRVGLTGSIASGKSVVASRLRHQGLAVIDLDKVGHEVLLKGNEAFEPVVDVFGSSILDAKGEIDRKALGSIVFADARSLERLNSIVHPAIRREEARRVEALARDGADVVITEAALLIESGQRERFDFFVVVGCPPEVQIARLVERDGLSVDDARRRLAAQLPFDEKKNSADYVIDTSGDIKNTVESADALAAEIRRRASKRDSV